MVLSGEPDKNTVVPNTNLIQAMDRKGYTIARLAKDTKMHVKSVERWRSGKGQPYPQMRITVAELLETPPDKLWKYTAEQVPADETPSVLADTHVPFSPTLYASRTQVPITVWHDHFADADRRIDVLVFAATFLFDTLDGFTTTLTQAAGRGVQVRVLVGDPNGDNMALRGEEEGIGESVKARSHNSVELLRPYATTSGLDVRTHETTLYTSIFRVDDDMIINFHIYGSPGRNNPVMIFSRSQEPRLWATLEEAFDRVWDNAKPLVSPANPSL